MLVLSRRDNETIVIDGGRIVITMIGYRNGKVRLGITAPPDVPVNRGEVHAAIEREFSARVRREDARLAPTEDVA